MHLQAKHRLKATGNAIAEIAKTIGEVLGVYELLQKNFPEKRRSEVYALAKNSLKHLKEEIPQIEKGLSVSVKATVPEGLNNLKNADDFLNKAKTTLESLTLVPVTKQYPQIADSDFSRVFRLFRGLYTFYSLLRSRPPYNPQIVKPNTDHLEGKAALFTMGDVLTGKRQYAAHQKDNTFESVSYPVNEVIKTGKPQGGYLFDETQQKRAADFAKSKGWLCTFIEPSKFESIFGGEFGADGLFYEANTL